MIEFVGRATLPEGSVTSSDTSFGAATTAGQGGWANDGEEKREKGEAKNEVHVEEERWGRRKDVVARLYPTGVGWVCYIVNCSGVA